MNFIARQKLRFDLGQSWLTVLNFTLIVVAASDKLALVVHLQTRTFVLLLVPAAIASVWLLGYLLDKARFWHAYQAEQNERNDMLKRAASSVHTSAER